MNNSFSHNHYDYLFRSVIWLIINIIVAVVLTQPSDINHIIFTILNVVSYVFCVWHWVKCSGSFLSLYVFFVLYTAVSNLGQSVLCLFSVPQEFLPLFDLVKFKWIFEEVRFQSLCSAALNLGTVLYVYRCSRVTSLEMRRESYSQLIPNRKSTYSLFLEVLLYVCLIYMAMNCLKMISMRQTMSYADFFEEGRGETASFFTSWLKYGVIALPLWAIFSKRKTTFVYASLGFFILALMLVGSRGLAIRYIAILMITLPIVSPNLFKKRYTVLWIAAAFVFFSFLSVISISRTESLSGGVFESDNAIGYNALATISEIGGAARPAALTIEANETSVPHHQTILVSLIRAVIPFSSRLPIVQRESFLLSDWVTEYAGSYWSGLGYSNIGELFMNYSWFGWVFMLFYGWFIAYAENTAYRNITKGKYLYAVILLTILTVQLVWARGEMCAFFGIWRSSIYFLVIGYFLAHGGEKKLSA